MAELPKGYRPQPKQIFSFWEIQKHTGPQRKQPTNTISPDLQDYIGLKSRVESSKSKKVQQTKARKNTRNTMSPDLQWMTLKYSKEWKEANMQKYKIQKKKKYKNTISPDLQ